MALESSPTTVELWDVSTGKSIANLPARGFVEAVAFSSNGRLLALAPNDGTSSIKLWDMSSGKLHVAMVSAHEKSEYSPQHSGVHSLFFSPDGKLLASGGTNDSLVKLWDVSSGKQVATLTGDNRGSIRSVVFSPNGQLLASRKHSTVDLWDVSEWTPTPHKLTSSSGDGQQGRAGTTLAEPFVVSVLDQYGSALSGAVVTFSVTAGGGTLSSTTATTDANGRARSTLTLGSELGTNTVSATIAGLAAATFTATAVEQTPHSLTKVSGDGQGGRAGEPLAKPFIVSVLDQDRAAFAGAVVTFSVTAGGGTLSATTVTTDANGRAATRLTLGNDAGTNTVTATVAGLAAVTFTATAITPHSLTKVCGDSQEGAVSEPLAKPLVVSVAAENGSAIAGVVVSFAVTAGGGTLSAATATTDANGRAAIRLTLGSDAGPNTVAATVEGLRSATFTATGEKSALASLFDAFGSGKLVALPDRTQLLPNAPNPFNSQTVLSYFLLEPGPVRLEVFALSGQRIAVLHQGPQQAGYHRLHWDGRDIAGRSVASGTYLYRLVTDETVLTRKLTLLR